MCSSTIPAGTFQPVGCSAVRSGTIGRCLRSFSASKPIGKRPYRKIPATIARRAAATVAFFGTGADGFGFCTSNEQKVSNLGTLRARAGTLIHDTLWYATGGFAWGTVKESSAFIGSANPVVFPAALQPGPFLPGAASFSSTRIGWTLGAGVETMIGGGWSAKLEYLYVDLGGISNTYPIAINAAFGPAFTAGGVASVTNTSHVVDNIVRVGLNYRFGGGAVVANY